LEQGEGFVLITGRPGTGKTTLVRDILAEQDESTLMAVNLVTNQFQGEELLRMVALAFGFQANDFNKATLLTRISDYATQLNETGRRVIILVDEAQNLTENGLEELRLLSNLQIGNKPLFQIFLIGQEELRNLIYGRGLQNIQQRILAACRLEPMDARHVEGYIEHRLGIAGWDHDPELDPPLFPLIQKLTQGVPREVNHLMSRLLLYGALEEKHRLTEEDLWVVVQELDREHRMGIDMQTAWASYQQEKGLTGEDQTVTGESDQSEAPEEIADAPEINEQSIQSEAPSSAVESAEVEREAAADHDEDSTEVAFFDTPPLLRDDYQPRQEKVRSVAPWFDQGAADERLDELPSLHVDDSYASHQHGGLLTDVDDLLDDETQAQSLLRRRWRWFFYPLLIVMLLVSLLVPKPGDLLELWPALWRAKQAQEPMDLKHQDEQQIADSPPPAVGVIERPAESPAVPPRQSPAESPESTSAPDSPQRDTDNLPLAHATVLPVQDRPLPGVSQLPIERDKDYLVELDSTGTGPAQGSLELVNAVLDAVNRDHRLLIVITGLTRSSESPLEQMRLALQRAESLTDYLVGQGVSPTRVSIEGSALDTADGAQEDLPQTVRLRLIRLKDE